MHRLTTRHAQTGVTLIELLVVVVIIAIIAAFAYPSYTQFVVEAKRKNGQSMLLQVADRQQQYFMDNKRYAAALSQLNFPADTFMIGDDGSFLADGDSDRIYQIDLTNTSATTFTARAVPQLSQATHDTDCGTLTLSHDGIKAAGGGAGDCW